MAYYGNFSPGGYSTQFVPGTNMPNPSLPQPPINGGGVTSQPMPVMPQPQPALGGGGLSLTPFTNPATGATIGQIGQLAPWMYGVGTPPAPAPAPGETIQPSPVQPAPETIQPQPPMTPMPQPPLETVMPQPMTPMPQPMGYLGMANQAATGAVPQPLSYGGGSSPPGYGNTYAQPMSPGMWNF